MRGEDIPFDTFRWRGTSKLTRETRKREQRKEGEGRLYLVLIPGRLLHIHKFCTECQPPVVMLRPRGRPGRLLAYFDDISASAVCPPLPLLLLLTGSHFSRELPPFLSFTRICIISFNYYSFCSAFNGSTTVLPLETKLF